MPFDGVGSTARYTWIPQRTLEVWPNWKKKAERAARLALEYIGEESVGCLEIECAVATGIGLGSSTCDVVAAIRAVCCAYGIQLDAARIAGIAIDAECAADPIMFENEVVLFAQRQGRVLESCGNWVPRYTVLSVDTDPARGGVETLSLPVPEYTDAELAILAGLIDRIRQAFRRRDSSAIAEVATASAELNQRFVPMRSFDQVRVLAERHGALGIQISHSGTVAGMLFEPRRVPPNSDIAAQVEEQLRAMDLSPLGPFATGGV
jgi:uncharacterized protein involved in propanediol utilization